MCQRFEMLSVRLLTSWWQRLRGLLGSDRDAQAVLIANCSSIHTCWMRYSIDVAFVSRDGQVLLSVRDLPPWRLLSCRKAAYVLERPARDEVWPDEGCMVCMDVVVR